MFTLYVHDPACVIFALLDFFTHLDLYFNQECLSVEGVPSA